jgi:peptidyl-Lys metalloendopeptidase
VVVGTSDYAYGQTACKSLAIKNSNKAINNADSHEYFAENNPVLQ